MRKFLFNVHLYLALVAGVFVLILGLTGGIMALPPGGDWWRSTPTRAKSLACVPAAGTFSDMCTNCTCGC